MSANLFLPAGATPLADSAARVLADILASAPPDSVKAEIVIREGADGKVVRATVAARIDGNNWAVGIGGFHEREADGDRTTGAGLSVSWR